ncbi:MAG: HAD family hydrolase [Alphaproteobacteria bacterium]|nr:HAD family hydrolase [Alphaproteobacteria bacterium]
MQTKTKLNMALFDAGGTLVGADNMFEHLATALGHPEISPVVFAKEFAKEKPYEEHKFATVKEILKKVCRNLSSEYNVPDIGDKACDIYRHTYTETIYLYPNVLETLSYLKDNKVRLVLVSDADSDVLNPQFEKLGLDRFFQDRIISSEIAAYKPSNKTIEEIKKQFDLPETGLLFIGDSAEDVETGKQLDADTVFIGQTNLNATHTVSSFEALLPLILETYLVSNR